MRQARLQARSLIVVAKRTEPAVERTGAGIVSDRQGPFWSIVDAEATVSWLKVQERIEASACALHASGVREEVPTLLAGARETGTVISWHALNTCGGVVVPADLQHHTISVS